MVCNGGGLGLLLGLRGLGGKKRPPLTEKSTKVSTKEERRWGRVWHMMEVVGW